MSDPLRERLTALVATWRERADDKLPDAIAAQEIRFCADDLEAALRAVPEGEAYQRLEAAVNALDPAAADDQPYDKWDGAKWDVFNAAVRLVKEAALLAAPEAEADLPQTKRERYLARRGADPHLRTVLTSARLILNHLHACSSEEELHRWRRAQQALIDAAIAVGRDLELNAAVGGGESR